MLRAIYLLLIVFFLPGCFVADTLECGYIFLASDIGSITTTPVPDQYVTIGDTVFFDVNQYWEYDYGCEGNMITEPDLGAFITNSNNVEFYRQEEFVFIIGKKPGNFSATIIGSADLRRNNRSRLHVVYLPLNINVVTEPVERERPRAIFPSIGRIDSVQVLAVEPDYPRVQLLAHYSPEVTIKSYSDFSAWWMLNPSLDDNVFDGKKFIYDFKDHGGSDNEYYFAPDSLQEIYHGYVEVEAKGRTYGRTFTLDLSNYLD